MAQDLISIKYSEASAFLEYHSGVGEKKYFEIFKRYFGSKSVGVNH